MELLPQPGDIFLTRIGGLVGGASSVSQILVALPPSIHTHAGIASSDGEVVAAQRGGARIGRSTQFWTAGP